ncbi:fimbrial protein [Budvicia diplopodorum]|uniref:fimbrial protein n=1 Tax=Budvicia diplopodorum TaxID=1119056 RepID=UPI00135C31F8|nr:fimbrial protein [Budvicia diplopodorum]
MDLNIRCRKWATGTIMVALLSCGIVPAQAITLNYSAQINQGTCQISLDQTTLSLGTVMLSSLRGNTLVAARPFTLQVRACGDFLSGQTPAIKITGQGMTLSGKWVFRSSVDSVAQGVGIMVAQSNTPALYSQTAIADGDYINLASVDLIPTDADFQFFAGITCGSSSDCTSANVQPGRITARIVFDFVYR